MKINFLKSRSVAEPKQNIGNYRGFTLIEMLISVTLFTFVGLMAVSTLVSSQQLNNNQKAVRLLYDNMYFTMEEIARELRQGNSYSLISDGILFKPYQPFAVTFYSRKYILNSAGAVEKQEDAPPAGFVSKGDMTSKSIKITNLKFEIVGGGDVASGDKQQPGVKIILKGETVTAPIIKFQLENFVSQRDSES